MASPASALEAHVCIMVGSGVTVTWALLSDVICLLRVSPVGLEFETVMELVVLGPVGCTASGRSLTVAPPSEGSVNVRAEIAGVIATVEP